MSHKFYLILHLGAVLALALSLGALTGWAFAPSPAKRAKAFLLSLHGLSCFLIFLAGFGLIAKTGLKMPYPWWIYAKLAVWLALSFAPFIVRKTRSFAWAGLFPLSLLFWLALLVLALLLVRL